MKDAIVLNVHPESYTVDIVYRGSGEKQFSVRSLGRVFWNLKKKDFVAVDFFDGDRSDPIIVDKILVATDYMRTDKKSVGDVINMIHEVKDDDGEILARLQVYTDPEGTLTIEASGTKGDINLRTTGENGNLNLQSLKALNVNVGDGAIINAEGDITVYAKGKAIVKADGDAELTATGKVKVNGTSIDVVATGLVKVDGAQVSLGLGSAFVNNAPVCMVLGTPHGTNVKVKA
jgi:hypothetical protein